MLYFYGDTYKEIIKDRKNFGCRINFHVIQLFDAIYDHLGLDQINDSQFGKTKVQHFSKLILSTGLMTSISDEHVSAHKMEDSVVNKVFFENFVQDVDEAIGSGRNCDIIHKRYGLDDGHFPTLEEVGAVYHISRERVRQIEVKSFRKIRKNHSMRKYF